MIKTYSVQLWFIQTCVKFLQLLSLQQDGTKVGAYLQKMILSIYTKVKELRQANPGTFFCDTPFNEKKVAVQSHLLWHYLL